jgi:hypothetical protein
LYDIHTTFSDDRNPALTDLLCGSPDENVAWLATPAEIKLDHQVGV